MLIIKTAAVAATLGLFASSALAEGYQGVPRTFL